MAEPDLRTDDELRRCIREGDPPARVLAAFELGKRLGAGAAGALRLEAEPSSGVRRHWLTVLASFGERDAVCAIAERHVGDAEGEHAMHLALQLGLGDAPWWARQFVGASESMQAALLALAGDRLAWATVVSAVESLLGSDVVETRRLAAQRLLALASHPGLSLRQYALERPDEADAVLRAWASGPEHRALVDALPVWSERRDAGLDVLRDCGQRVVPCWWPARRYVVLMGWPLTRRTSSPAGWSARSRGSPPALQGGRRRLDGFSDGAHHVTTDVVSPPFLLRDEDVGRFGD